MQDAIIAADGDSRIVFWNASAERIFGWPREEVLGRSLTTLMPERFHAAHHAGIARVRDGGEARVLGGPPAELVGLRADGTEFPIELTLGRWDDAGKAWFTGVVRDVSDRERSRRMLATQYEVAVAVAGAHDLDAGICDALRAIGVGMGWRAGQVWVADAATGVLRCRAGWSQDDEALEEFLAGSSETTFAAGIGLPGRVWQEGRAAWVSDVLADRNFPRQHLAAAVGLRGALAVPLVAEGRVHGVLELLSGEVRRPDPEALAVIEALGQQLGQFLLRREAENELARRERQEQQAAELNDEVVQSLVLARYHLAAGRVAEGEAAVAGTLEAAREIVSDLLAGGPVEPGALRRTRAARAPREG